MPKGQGKKEAEGETPTTGQAWDLPPGAEWLIPQKLAIDQDGNYIVPWETPGGISWRAVRKEVGDAMYADFLAEKTPAAVPFTQLPPTNLPATPPWSSGYSDISGIQYGPEIGSATVQRDLEGNIIAGPLGTEARTIPGKAYQPGQVFQFQGKTYQVDRYGQAQPFGAKKTLDMSTPPNGVRQYTDPYGKIKTWSLIDPDTGRYDYIETGYDPAKDVSQTMTEYQKQQLELQRQGGERETTRLSYERSRDIAAEAAEKERRLAELAARPINWLQYAAETKTPPVVQPWMMPLSQEQYGWKVGEPIPGASWGTRAQTVGQEPQFFSEEERQRYANAPTTPAPAGQDWRFFAGQWQLRNKEGAIAGSETLPTTAQGMNFQNMPELLRPSAQLWARMGPTAQQQYYGYQQAQSGISPEEQEFRRQSTLPPGGRAPRWIWSR